MKKVIKNFEEFGRAFLVPVAVLPFVGILLGIGTGFSSKDLVSTVPFLGIPILKFLFGTLIVVGKAVFDNLPLLFAVGLAIGFSKKEKGAAAVGGLVGYVTFIYVLNYALNSRGLLVEPSQMAQNAQKIVLGKQVYDVNVVGGIIIGLLASRMTQYGIDKKLPEVLSFFEGPRLVPLITILASIFAAIGASFIWPVVAKGITSLSVFLTGLGGFGAFFYGALERLFIPFGLHHGLNSLLKYTELGGSITVDGIKHSGYINMFAAALQNTEIMVTSEITKFYGGQYIVKIFGLAGAALAIYKTSFLKHRSSVKALLIGSTFASILTGVTEPLEFTFLFVAPMLYLVHAVLAGAAFFVMYITKTAALSIQGAGLINFVLYNVLNSSRIPWFKTIIIGPIFFALYYFIFKFLIEKFDFKTPGRADEMTGLTSKKEAKEKYGIGTQKNNETGKKVNLTAEKFIEAFGGINNIDDIDACFTRLRVDVKDLSKIDKKTLLGELEAKGLAESGNQVQAIYGGKAKDYKRLLREHLGLEI